MKFELLHLILAEVSTWDHGMSKAVQIDGYPEEEVMKHVGYLYDEGMLNARAAVYKGGAEYYPRSLTMHGHKTFQQWNAQLQSHLDEENRSTIGFK